MAERFECVLRLLSGHRAAGLVRIEAQRLGIVGAKPLGLLQHAPMATLNTQQAEKMASRTPDD